MENIIAKKNQILINILIIKSIGLDIYQNDNICRKSYII